MIRNTQLSLSITLVITFAILDMGVGYAQARGPNIPQNVDARVCEWPSDRLRESVRLDRDCIYEQSFEIDDADVVLDCNGATIQAGDEYAVHIKRDADGARVENCYIDGGKGIAVRVRRIRDGESDDDVRALSPQGVVIDRVQIANSINVGVHLHTHTVGVTVQNSRIVNSSGPGIYMSPYGKRHQILNNLIEGNGHRKPDGFPRIGWYRREGIAIDGSSEHYIADNDISDNSFGGILLYKNCWEHAAEEPNSRPRTDHARANLIERNHFSNQPFGVWVAARQSRDLSMMGCGDPTPYRNPIAVNTVFHPTYSSYPSANTELYLLTLNTAAVWPDFAEDNEIRNNVFEDIIRGGVRVEDDGTTVADNLFIGEFDYVFVGAPFRARLANQPIADTSIVRNSFVSDSSSNFRERLALIPDEHIRTELDENYRACPKESGGFARHGEMDADAAEQPGDACQGIVTICDNGNWAEATLDADCDDQPVDQFVDDMAYAADATISAVDYRDLGMPLDAEQDSDAGVEQGQSDADSGERGSGSLPVGRDSSRGQGCAVSAATSSSPLLPVSGGVAICLSLLIGGRCRRSLPRAQHH